MMLAKKHSNQVPTDLNHKQVIKAFVKAGWTLVEGGNHARLIKEGFKPLTIPRHNPIKAMLLKSQIKQAGLTIEAFNELL
jgi:predicted RNA binding protein YcfA (HicA-like mRNA interferase family)